MKTLQMLLLVMLSVTEISLADQLVTPVPISGGKIDQIAIDPANSRRIAVGTTDHGVFLSDDSGQSWRRLMYSGRDQMDLTTFDPLDPDIVLYANYASSVVSAKTDGTWPVLPYQDRDGLPNRPRCFAFERDRHNLRYTYGLFTVDNVLKPFVLDSVTGQWRQIEDGTGVLAKTFSQLFYNPVDSLIYLVGSRGLFSTADSATGWTFVTPRIKGEAAYNYYNNTAVNTVGRTMVNLGVDSLFIYRLDSDSIQAFARPDSIVHFVGLPMSLAVAQDTTLTVFVVSRNALFVTSDGATWDSIALDGLPTVVATDPSDPDVVYVGTQRKGLLKSSDRGQSWTFVNNGGIAYWRDMSDIVIDPTDPQNLYVPIIDYVAKSSDGGLSWTLSPGISGVPYDLEIAPDSPAVLYGGVIGQLYRTTDRFETISFLGDYQVMGNTGQVVIHPQNPGKVFAVSSHQKGIFVSDDMAETWDSLPLPEGKIGARNLIFDPQDPARMFVQLRDPTVTGASYDLYETTDTGATWSRRVEVFDYWNLLFDPHSRRLVAWGDNNDPKTVYSSDGLIWDVLEPEVMVDSRVYAISPLTPAMQLVDRDYGSEIWATRDTMHTWYDISSALPANVSLKKAVFDPVDTSVVYLVTNMHGLFRVDLSYLSDNYSGIRELAHKSADSMLGMRVVGPRFAPRLLLPEGFAPQRVSVFSLRGRLIRDLQIQQYSSGGIALPTLPGGMYVLRVTGRAKGQRVEVRMPFVLPHPLAAAIPHPLAPSPDREGGR